MYCRCIFYEEPHIFKPLRVTGVTRIFYFLWEDQKGLKGWNMTWSLASFRLSHRPGKPEKSRALKSFLSSVHLPLEINRICYLSYLLWTVGFQLWLFSSAFHASIINCSTCIWAEEPWKLCLRPPGVSAHLPGQRYVLGAMLHCQLGMEAMRHKSCNSSRVKILWVARSFTFHWHVHNTCNV